MRRRPKMGSEAQKSMAITGVKVRTAGGGGDAIHRNRDKEALTPTAGPRSSRSDVIAQLRDAVAAQSATYPSGT